MRIPGIWIKTKPFEASSTEIGAKRQAEHRAGIELLQQGLLECYNLKADFLSDNPDAQRAKEDGGIVIEKGQHGKPYLAGFPDIHFNISHCDGLAVCAIYSRPVGIDVERVRPCQDGLLRRVLTEKERQQVLAADGEEEQERCFVRFWTLKESYLKAVGCGITVPLTDVEFDLADRETNHIVCSVPGYSFWQEQISEDIILSVCAANHCLNC